MALCGGRLEKTDGGDNGDTVGNWHAEALSGAGAIVSTPNDMLAYAKANLDTTTGPLAAAMALAQRPRQSIDHRTWGSGLARIGYAWVTDGDGFVWHNGATGGFRSFLGLDRRNHRAIFIAANAAVDSVFSIGFHALDPALPAPSAPLPDVVVAHSTLASYVGRYRLAAGPLVVVTLDSRGLAFACDKPAFTGRLHARSATTFALPSDFGTVEFAGKGASMTLTVMLQGFPKDVGERVPQIARYARSTLIFERSDEVDVEVAKKLASVALGIEKSGISLPPTGQRHSRTLGDIERFVFEPQLLHGRGYPLDLPEAIRNPIAVPRRISTPGVLPVLDIHS